MSNTSKVVASIIVAVVAVVLILIYGASNSTAPTTGTTSTSTVAAPVVMASTTTEASSGTTVRVTGTSGTKTTGKVTTPTPAPEPAPKQIILITPVPGVTWTITQDNVISWQKAAGTTGQIELLDASTMALVGVILPQVGPNQSSYTWNTRDLLLSRTNPEKTTVTAGRYIIRIAFDSPDFAPITSQPINISN